MLPRWMLRIGRGLACGLGIFSSCLSQPALAQGQQSAETGLKQVTVGMTMRDTLKVAGPFIARVEIDPKSWEDHITPSEAVGRAAHVGGEGDIFDNLHDKVNRPKIWLSFRNETQFPGEGLTDFTVYFELGHTVKSITKHPRINIDTINPKACPAQDFTTFLNLFSQSEEVQRRYTYFPFEYTLPTKDWENTRIFRKVTIKSWREFQENFKIPIFPNWNERFELGLNTYLAKYDPFHEEGASLKEASRKETSLKLKGLADRKAFLVALGGNDPYAVNYEFSYRNKCWWLVSFRDINRR